MLMEVVRMCVVIVDPNRSRVEGLVSAFQYRHVSCVAYCTVERFWADLSVSAEGPQCLIIASDLPEMSGLSLVGRLREREVWIPVVLVTDKGNIEEFCEAVRLGVVGVFHGNFDDSELISRVLEVLEGCAPVPTAYLVEG
jgi:FixJ family two-component response regulator